MITDAQKALMLEQYSKRGILKKEIRSYEVSLWTLQDSFITVLKWSDAEQKGRIQDPKMKLNIDGTQEFTFSIPMYYYFHGKMITNENWYNTRNGNIMASMRKVKVIFNKATDDEAVFEFLIVDVKETHENDILTCELKCEGLAFHELGKIGYIFSLSQDVFELEYEKWQKTRSGPEPVQTLDYWCSKIDLPKYPTSAALINAATWYYKVNMKYTAFNNVGPQRSSEKVYEENYVRSWSADLKPRVTENYTEKARPISIENSNVYNITQELAEKFNIFCRYEYTYDENYHIKSRCIVFYNNYLEEDRGVLTFMYPHSSSKITREMDATNLTTKLYVSDVEDDTIFSGYHSIMNVEANKTKENYILNFDYMLKIGTITQEQYDSIRPYEIKMRQYNEELTQKQANLAAYQEQAPELEAKIAVLEKSITTATEQITQNNRLKNALDAADGDADGFITVGNSNPDQRLIVNNTEGHLIRMDNTNKGIDVSTIHIYRSYNGSDQTFSNEITSFEPIYEPEYNTLIKISVPAQTGSQTVYLTYKYNPTLYYDKIVTIWETKLGKDNNDLTKLKDQLGTKNETTDRGESGLYKIITDTEDRIDELLDLKRDAIHAFERVMGPALREGYWQPEDYNDYGEQKEATATLTMSDPAIIMTASTGNGMAVGWEMDLFDGEQDIYYNQGITEDKVYYPCINLTSIYEDIRSTINEYSFIFNNNYYNAEANINDIKNIQVYKVGSQALLRFVRQGNNIYPALIIVGAKSLTDAELDFMFDNSKGHPRLAKISTTINEGTGTVSTSIQGAINVSDDRFWKFNGEAITTCNVVYPRIKFSSLALKTDTTNLVLRYANVLLKQFEDYRINTRTVERDGNYYPEYFITLKPDVIFLRGFNQEVKVDYILSNADTSIYLDALDVSKENAYPKVSYEITPNILNPNLSHILYQKLAQVVMINDIELKLEDTFGYISEIDLDLDDVSKDSITVQNYKTKFEDLFSNIVAQTESMKHASQALSAAAAGSIALTGDAFSATLQQNQTILDAYLDSHFDSSQVVIDKLTSLFTEAGQILAASSETLNSMHVLTTDNATILGGFAQDVSQELATKVYRSPTKPATFKFGDIWIQTDNEGNEIGRYMATSNGTTNKTGTAGFVRTWDGTLAQIYGASLNIDADQGIIDVEARNYINIKSGKNIYIAANERVDIVGNESVNIGGSELNFCSLYEQDKDGNQGNLIPTKGINLIAGQYSQKDQAGISKVIITPTRLEFGSSEILMKAASSITMISSTGTGANTAAVSIDANKGVWLGAGAGVHIYSGTAADRIYIGPKHPAKFQQGDIWVKINKISANGNDTYDGDQSIADVTKRYYYTNYIQSGNDYSSLFTIAGKYLATASWDDVYESEAAANTGMNSTTGWQLSATILEDDDILNAKGASVDITDEHLMFGYSNVQKNTSNSTAIEMTDEYVLIAAGDNFQTMQGRSVTGMSNSLIGAKFTKDSIGMAVGSGNNIAAFIMNLNGLTMGHGLGSVNIGTATAAQLRAGVQSTGGSYVRIAYDSIELGSTANLYINTNNFKLQTDSKDPRNSAFTIGNTIFAIGANMNDITSATTPAQIQAADGKNGVDVKLVVNEKGVYLKGDVYALNGHFNGDIVARTLYANGGLNSQNGTGFVFAVDGNYLGMYRIIDTNGKISDSSTEKLLYFDSATNTLWITGTLKVSKIMINEEDQTQSWGDYFSNLPLDYMETVDTKITELFDQAGQVINAAISSASDVSALNNYNESRLATFKTNIVDGLRPDEFTGESHGAKFKKGDIWNRKGTNNADLGKYIATRNWDEVYSTLADADTAAAKKSTNGWNRVSAEGVLADIRGASLTIDTVAGDITLLAQNSINLRAKALISLIGNDIEITASKVNNAGGNLNLSGDTSVNIASGGGIYLVTSSTYNGTKAVSIDSAGIDLASNSNVQIRAGGSINIYSASETNASAFRINKTEGIWVGTDQKIDFAATANGSGSALQLNKDRILMGVTTSSNTGAVDITAEQIILGIANAATGMENMNIALDGSASGVRITKDVIQLATGNANRRSLISMGPDRVFIGTAAKTAVTSANNNLDTLKTSMKNSTAQNTGAYIDITNSSSNNYPIFEIGSTAQFTILTPKFKIDNLATGDTAMLYMADNATWASATAGIKFCQNGLEIKANRIDVAASNIHLTSGDLQSTLDESIQQTIRWYRTTDSDTTPTVPSGWSTSDLSSDWTKTIEFASRSGDHWVWSTTQYIRGDGKKSYDTPTTEGRLANLSDITYKVYKRTSSSTKPTTTTYPTKDTNGALTNGWTTKVPAASVTITPNGTSDSSTGAAISHNTSSVDLPYLWSLEVTEHLNGTFTYGDVEEEQMFEDAVTGKRLVDDIIAGRSYVKYVKSSGLTIDGDYVALTSSGTMALLGNSKILIGVAAANGAETSSTISLQSSGININSGGNITIKSGGSFTVASGNFNIDSAGNVSITGNITSAGGTIGPWKILSDRIYNDLVFDNDESCNSTGIGTVSIGNTVYGFWAGDGAFSVTQDGVVRCKKMIIDGQEVDLASS